MTLASGSRVDIAYVAETTFGTTPTTPQMILLPKHSSTLDLTKQLMTSKTIASNRIQPDERHGNYVVGGDIVTAFSYHQYDDFLEAGFAGTWTSNVLKQGTTSRSFTIEEGFLDIVQYRRFTGCRINTIDITVPPGDFATMNFGIVGAGLTTSQTALDATETAVLGSTEMTHIGGTFTVGGTAIKATTLSLKLDNQMAPAYALGSSAALDVIWKESMVSGSVTVYYEDLVMYNRFLNETTAALSFTLSDGTNNYIVAVPKAKFNTGAIALTGSGEMFVTMAYVGLFDSSTGTAAMITRSS